MWKVFRLFLRVGLFSFGGGNSAMPYIEYEVVEKNKWLTADEFYELVAITNSLPGPNMVQVGSYIGRKQAGTPGLIMAVFAILFPPTMLFIVIILLFKDHINEEITEKLATGAMWFVMSLLIAMCYKMIKSTILSNGNKIFILLLFLLSTSLMILNLLTALIIVIGFFLIGFYSFVIERVKGGNK